MKKIILASILGVVILIIGLILSNKQGKISSQNLSPPTNSPISNGFESKVSNEGGVEVAVTPIDIKADPEFWSFQVSMNTHSVGLDQDMMASSLMEVGNGKSYNPIIWEGAPPGGHHRNGVLKFKSISPLPSEVVIKIKGVGGISEREFKWLMK